MGLAAASVLLCQQPDYLLCLHRSQGSSKPREEGPGRAGSTRGEPTPHLSPFPLAFLPLAPSSSLSSVSWFITHF